MARRKRFTDIKAAHSFAKKVNGKLNDLRQIEGAKSTFTVTYKSSDKTQAHDQIQGIEFAPEEGRDFGYPNDFWQ